MISSIPRCSHDDVPLSEESEYMKPENDTTVMFKSQINAEESKKPSSTLESSSLHVTSPLNYESSFSALPNPAWSNSLANIEDDDDPFAGLGLAPFNLSAYPPMAKIAPSNIDIKLATESELSLSENTSLLTGFPIGSKFQEFKNPTENETFKSSYEVAGASSSNAIRLNRNEGLLNIQDMTLSMQNNSNVKAGQQSLIVEERQQDKDYGFDIFPTITNAYISSNKTEASSSLQQENEFNGFNIFGPDKPKSSSLEQTEDGFDAFATFSSPNIENSDISSNQPKTPITLEQTEEEFDAFANFSSAEIGNTEESSQPNSSTLKQKADEFDAFATFSSATIENP